MLITSKKIQDDLGFRYSWISARFRHVAKDAMNYGRNQFDVDDLIAVIKGYTCVTVNPYQKAISESMMKKLLNYLKGLK